MLNNILIYYKKEKKYLIIFLLSSFIVSLLDLFSPLMIQRLIDNIIPHKNMKLFFSYLFFLLSVYIFRFIISVYSSNKGQIMGIKIKFLMRNDLVKTILKQPPLFFKKNKSGDLISRITQDLENSSVLLSRGLEDLLFSCFSILAAFLFMLKFNLLLTLFCILPLPFAIYFSIFQNRALKKGYTEIKTRFSEITSNIHDLLRTIFFIKDNTLEKEMFYRFNSANETLLNTERKNSHNISLLMSGINLYNQLTQLIIIFVGGYLYIEEKISFGVIVSFLLLTNRFRIYILRLISLIDSFQKGATGIKRFLDLINLNNIEDGKHNLISPISNIKFDSIYFSYDEKTILNNISFEAFKGDKIAFVGESGIGKTTLLNLLKKVIKQNSGEIFINSHNIKNIEKESYLNSIGVIDQNDSILNSSILENLKIIKKNSKKEEIIEALKLALLDEFINCLPEGINTPIDKINLSSGQKQRISFARIFLKKPDVLILDEATSNLDPIIESKILKNLNTIFKNKIIISVTHRLETLTDFNKIFVIGKNGIEEFGDFKALLEKKGIFYNMYTKKI